MYQALKCYNKANKSAPRDVKFGLNGADDRLVPEEQQAPLLDAFKKGNPAVSQSATYKIVSGSLTHTIEFLNMLCP